MYLCGVSNRAIFDQFFVDLGHLKIDNVVNAFAEDGYYQDMPVATDPTVGRDAIRKKLTFLTAAQQLDFNFSLVTEVGNSILAERVEVWHFASGETPTLPVMCVRDGLPRRPSCRMARVLGHADANEPDASIIFRGRSGSWVAPTANDVVKLP